MVSVMRTRGWHVQNSVRPFVLRSQLYSSVSDRTTADRELEVLICFGYSYGFGLNKLTLGSIAADEFCKSETSAMSTHI